MDAVIYTASLSENAFWQLGKGKERYVYLM